MGRHTDTLAYYSNAIFTYKVRKDGVLEWKPIACLLLELRVMLTTMETYQHCPCVETSIKLTQSL